MPVLESNEGYHRMVIDLFFIGIAIIGFLVGYRQGVVQPIIRVATVGGGIVLSLRIVPAVTDNLRTFFVSDERIIPFLGLLLSVLISVVFIQVAGRLLHNFLISGGLDAFNQFLGGVVVALGLLFLYSGVIWFLMKADIVRTYTVAELEALDAVARQRADSRTLPYIQLFLYQFDVFVAELTASFNMLWMELKALFLGEGRVQ